MLGHPATKILRRAIELPRKRFNQTLPSYSLASIEELQNFISHEKVVESKVWLKEFHARPPRRTLERLATTLDAKLHYCNGFHGYTFNSDFETEMERIYRWYKPGRKILRHKRGIKRGPKDGPWKHRMQGLLNWKLAATALIRAATQRQIKLFKQE